MSITIDIEPSLEAALKRRATELGLTLEQFARQLLEQGSSNSRKHHPRIEVSLRTIETLRGKLGPVPEEATSPETLYREG